jgi:NAD(P)-dependent dehydrogenase (short-subunit alcohol dehydrogenase family)
VEKAHAQVRFAPGLAVCLTTFAGDGAGVSDRAAGIIFKAPIHTIRFGSTLPPRHAKRRAHFVQARFWIIGREAIAGDPHIEYMFIDMNGGSMALEVNYRGKNVFVAGGTSGINLGIADAFAQAGARVAVMSRNADRVSQAVEQLKQHHHDVRGYVGDVRDMSAVEKALRSAHQAFGEIDVLVSGAAGNFLAPALDISSNGFKAVIDIDLVGTFHVLRAGFEVMRRPGGSMINISAPQSTSPAPMQVHVCAAKAGLDQVMRVLALEWGQMGLRVNSIMPGPIADSGGFKKLVSTDELDRLNSRIPLGRVGTLADVAAMALFLGSSHASYITGALIPVDGGVSLLGGRNYAGEIAPTPRSVEAARERTSSK